MRRRLRHVSSLRLHRSRRGRFATQGIRRGQAVIGAVDIGGTKIAAGIVDDHGRVAYKRETPTAAAREYANGLKAIVRMLRETSAGAGVQLSGIGIGSTGWVYPFTGEFGDVDFFPGWKGWNTGKDLAREFRGQVGSGNAWAA